MVQEALPHGPRVQGQIFEKVRGLLQEVSGEAGESMNYPNSRPSLSMPYRAKGEEQR